MNKKEIPSKEPIGLLLVIALAQLLALTVWFSATAVAPTLRDNWNLNLGQVSALTTTVQIGFVVGALGMAILNIADLVKSRILFCASGLTAAAANTVPTFLSGDDFTAVLALRFLTGVCLAGVYPSGLKVMAGWFRKGRGMAMGVLVGALTVGSAVPHLIKGFGLDWRVVLWVSSALCVFASLLMLRVGDGPFETKGAKFSFRLIARVVSNRGFRSATAGYLGHMWELYAMWTWLAAWLSARLVATSGGNSTVIPSLTFAIIACGGIGSWLAGVWADRFGRPLVAGASMVISGSCALVTPLLFLAPAWVAIPILILWGLTIVADSAQFSAIVTETVDEALRGTALTLQAALGFSLTLASIRITSYMASTYGWQWAFPVLAIGPLVGVVAMTRVPKQA